MPPDNTGAAAKNNLPTKGKTSASQANPPMTPKRTYVAMLRADFYYDRYYPLLVICLCLLVMGAILTLGGLYERTITPVPDYFPTTRDGKLVAPVPLSQAGVTTPALLEWAVEAITNSYTFNFIDYEKIITDASIYYTQAGYQNYRRALIESNIVGSVERKKYVITVVPTMAPNILKEKPTPEGIYSWLVQFPIMLTLQNVKEVVKKDMIVTMLIIRVPITESPNSLATAALIIREGKL